MIKPDLTTPDFLDSFCEHLRSLSKTHNEYLIAYSGGLDSHVLLHLCVSLAHNHSDIKFRSIYIDHGLQDTSKGWADHCERVSTELGIEFQSMPLNIEIQTGESLEAVARKARYQALRQHLSKNETLMTAQHQDDQAETVLLQLLRGAGLDGLAAMPRVADFGEGLHIRPLLEYSRGQLEAYAKHHHLDFITDPSNKDSRFDRNYLRNQVIPLLKQRWPQMGQTLSRSAGLQAEAGELLATFIDKEMPVASGNKKDTLSAKAVTQLPSIKQKAMLRYWIKRLGFKAPSAVKLKHLIEDVLNSRMDSMPLVTWQDAEVRRYKDDVYIMSPLPTLLPSEAIEWDLQEPLVLGRNLPHLTCEELGDLKDVVLQKEFSITVRFRQGGERIRLENRTHSISLKNFFQENEVPPWLRKTLPLVYANDQIIYIPGLYSCSLFGSKQS